MAAMAVVVLLLFLLVLLLVLLAHGLAQLLQLLAEAAGQKHAAEMRLHHPAQNVGPAQDAELVLAQRIARRRQHMGVDFLQPGVAALLPRLAAASQRVQQQQRQHPGDDPAGDADRSQHPLDRLGSPRKFAMIDHTHTPSAGPPF